MFALLLLTSPLAAQEFPVVRTQTIGERTYVQIRLKAPADLFVPRAQRQAIEKMAPYDLGPYPRLISEDKSLRNIAWSYSTDQSSLEFLGIGDPKKEMRFRLHYPTETGDKPPKPIWKEVELALDGSTAKRVEPISKRIPRSPALDDLAGRWAAAWAREFAVRERMAGDADALRVARQELCRRYNVADPLPKYALPEPKDESANRTISIKEIPGIEAAEQTWDQLLAGRKVEIEPLAAMVPAEFHYIRVRNPSRGLAALEKLGQLAGIGASLWLGASQDFDLRNRYLRQLQMPFEAKTGYRLPRHIHECAIVGSDLHFRMGTDITILFDLSDAAEFDKETDADWMAARGILGDRLKDSSATYRDLAIKESSTADGEARVFRTRIGKVAICSNSPAAIRRVIDSAFGHSRRLADTPDFRLFRSSLRPNDPAEDVLMFFSESFLREQFGPRHRILLKRRAAELVAAQAKNHVELFAAWNAGRSPKLPETVLSPPLIERPIDKITKEEDEFYQAYREHYRVDIEPLAAPMGLRIRGDADSMTIESLVLTLRRADFWDDLHRHLGKGVVAREANEVPNAAARLVVSYTPTELDRARFKNWLINKGVDPKKLAFRPQWMGDRVTLHLDDNAAVARLIEHYLHADLTASDLAQSRSERDQRWLLSQLPVSVSLAVAKPVMFLGWLTKMKEIVNETWPKTFTFDTLPQDFRKVKMHRVQPNAAISLLIFGKVLKPEELPGGYYAYGDHALVVSPNLNSLKAGIARDLLPSPARERNREETAAAWFSANIGLPEIQSALSAYLQRESHRQALMSIALRQWLHDCGAPLDPRWLGFVPASIDQATFRVVNGEIVSDRHGSSREPKQPNDGSWRQLLAQFSRIRAEVHVRPEGMHGTFTIGPR